MTAIQRLLALGCLLGWAVSAVAEAVVCAVDRPVAEVGGTVELMRFGGAADATWTVSEGQLELQGERLIWKLPQRAGRHQASLAGGVCKLTVYAVYANEASRGLDGLLGGRVGSIGRIAGGTSSAQPSAAPAPAPQPSAVATRETGSLLLLSGKAEPAGQGLYSYFLLGAVPDDSARERVLAALDAYLRLSPSLASLQVLLDARSLNANLLPVTGAVAPLSAKALLEKYDYARARAILVRIDPSLRGGPYLMSLREPAVAGGGELPGPMLLQDLSAVPPHLVSHWTRHFLNQAAQEQFWEESTLAALGLRMRTLIGVLALGLPDVQLAVQQWVKWKN